MKLRSVIALVALSVTGLMAAPAAKAQFELGNTIKYSFSMPTSVDPVQYYFTNGETKFVSAADLLLGIEVHSKAFPPNAPELLYSFGFETDYAPAGVTISGDTTNTINVANWDLVISNGGKKFDWTWKPGGVAIGQPIVIFNNHTNQYESVFAWGLFTVDFIGPDANDLRSHFTSNFSGRGTAGVPEPGAIALLSGVVSAGAIVGFRRRK